MALQINTENSVLNEAQTKIHLDFQGFWREWNIPQLPQIPGLYCVYACQFDPRSQRLHPTRLLFIGKSDNLQREIQAKTQQRTFKSLLRDEEQLCFTIAPIVTHRHWVHQALLEKHGVRGWNKFKKFTLHQSVEINLSGKIPFLSYSFSIPGKNRRDELPPLRASLKLARVLRLLKPSQVA